jgi:hypothetical protein
MGPQLRDAAGLAALRRLTTSRSTLFAVGLLCVAFLLRAIFLGERQLFRDEAASWLLARYPLPDLLMHTAQEPYPPLYLLVLKGWTWVAGDSEAALRALSVAFGMVVVIVGWRWTRESMGVRAGLVGLALLAISPLAIANARDVRMYAMESACATTAWWLTWRLASGRSEGRRRWVDTVALALAVSAELWTFSLGLPIAALQFAVSTVGWIRGRRSQDLFAPAAIVVGGTTFLPWLPTAVEAANGQPFWTPPPHVQDLAYTYASVLGGFRLTPWIPGAAIVLILAGVGVVLLVTGRAGASTGREGTRRAASPLGAAVVAGLALVPLVWLYSQFHSVYDSRYFGACVAPLALGAAIGCTWASKRITSSGARSLAWLGVASLLLGGTITWIGDWRSEVGLAPARQLLVSLEQRMRPGDVAVSLDARSYFQMAYLLGRDGTPDHLPGPLYCWNSGDDPFFYGQSLLPPGTLVSADDADRMDWPSRLPGLAAHGSIWLIALANGASERLGFRPLDLGDVHEVERVFVAPTGETGQLRELVVNADSP